MVKVKYICVTDKIYGIDDPILNEIHIDALDENSYWQSEIDKPIEEMNFPIVQYLNNKMNYGDGITILYSDAGYQCTSDPLGLYTHIIVSKEV